MKVLIVGYDAYLLSLVGKILERSGYIVACVLGEEDVNAAIDRENPGLVIADLETDENERVRFCRTVKEKNNPPKLLFIGNSGEEETVMLNAGADDWIKKPYKTAVFLARISALFRQSRNDIIR